VTNHVSRGLRDKNAKLDAGRRVMAGSDGEIEVGAIANASGHRNLKAMRSILDAAAVASDARLSPRLAATAAVVARAAHRHLERHHGAITCLPMRELNRRAQRGSPLVGEKRAPHAIDGGSHRRKIDDDLIREATYLRTTVGAADNGHRSDAERTKGIATHEPR